MVARIGAKSSSLGRLRTSTRKHALYSKCVRMMQYCTLNSNTDEATEDLQISADVAVIEFFSCKNIIKSQCCESLRVDGLTFEL